MSDAKQLRYSASRDVYHLDSSRPVIETRPVEPTLVDAFEREQYDVIFSQYDPDTDRVETKSHGADSYFLLRRQQPGEADLPDTLEAGLYQFRETNYELVFSSETFPSQDDYVSLGNNAHRLEEDMRRFFGGKNVFRNMGMACHRGCLMYGPPGNGKTRSLLRAARQCAQAYDTLIFYVSSSLKNKFDEVGRFGDCFADRPTVLILEEVTEHQQYQQAKLLSLLDGESTWKNNYTIATTNYPNELEENLVDRPGRFDLVLPVDPPDREDRRRYLAAQLGEQAVSEELIDATDGYSVAYLRELIVRSRLYEEPLEDAYRDLEDIRQRIDDAFKDPEDRPGFARNGAPF